MTSGTDGTDGTDPGGAVAQEALRLAEAVSDWARSTHPNPGDARPDAETSRDTDPPSAERTAGRSCGCHESGAVDSVCRVCPICRVATVVQAIQPEALERVADVLAMFAGSLNAVAEDRRAGARNPTPSSPAKPEHTDIPVSGDTDDEGGAP
ncbi:hypothetical protein [Leekyejoonella antrihumi]|uniref:Uncharacterized protein n=1 Tax=Leekyejoonella antrihumi TaxID=1660198 RepID=A0A563E448_9MICO|nr:hypothetical protein [Leekyejoonella antrihumi]TWP36981.1 hypothetical protein FGL98_07955 [Leekyejoonella antrihumi]